MVEASRPDSDNEEYKGDDDGAPRESIAMADAALDNAHTQALFDNEQILTYTVTNPHDERGHIVYEVRGVDSQGEFSGNRRYNDFHALHDQLTKRWPGMLIPQIPKKKSIGNKDRVYLMERRFYLERFLRGMAKYPFLVNSIEFQMFARPTGSGDVSKALEKLPKMSPDEIYERIKQATQCDDADYDDRQKEQHDRAITEFAFFVKKTEPFLKQLKNDMATFLTTKQKAMKARASMATLLTAYEE